MWLQLFVAAKMEVDSGSEDLDERLPLRDWSPTGWMVGACWQDHVGQMSDWLCPPEHDWMEIRFLSTWEVGTGQSLCQGPGIKRTSTSNCGWIWMACRCQQGGRSTIPMRTGGIARVSTWNSWVWRRGIDKKLIALSKRLKQCEGLSWMTERLGRVADMTCSHHHTPPIAFSYPSLPPKKRLEEQ